MKNFLLAVLCITGTSSFAVSQDLTADAFCSSYMTRANNRYDGGAGLTNACLLGLHLSKAFKSAGLLEILAQCEIAYCGRDVRVDVRSKRCKANQDEVVACETGVAKGAELN